MATISIFTYNILSQNLAEQMTNEIKDSKEVYNMSFMNSNYRWNKISSIIQTQINDSKQNLNLDYLIFCLQEVTEEWVSNFATLFNSNDYNYINVQHGRVFNGNMGVLIAYPKTLKIVKSEFYTVGQHIMVTDENSKLAASKTNTAILLLLEQTNVVGHLNGINKIGIVTYHMPLEPKIPHVSMSHSKVLMKKIFKFMEDNIWFFGGDFNITPDSRTYQYFISVANSIWEKNNEYPITNHAFIKGFEFAGCLDYIFFSKHLTYDNCLKIKYDNVTNIIPNNIYPSDHIPIYAKFNL
jgi:mRNA deadenylase 3'-5' endonuclease subunit Ccr4